MTEMAHGGVPLRAAEAVLPRWWRTVDRWTIGCVVVLFGIGLLLALASSPPLAARNGLHPFHYVQRQLVFGLLAMVVMLITSMLSPATIRRLAVVGFLATLLSLLALPFLGTDFGKGAVRWYSLGFTSVQPSEFLKPFLAVFAAWLLAAGHAPDGPPGRSLSLGFTMLAVALLVIQPDFGQAALIAFAWGVMYFVSGAPIALLLGLGGAAGLGGLLAYHSSEHFARRIYGFLTPEVDPRTQIGFATNAIQEGGFFGVGVGGGQVKWSLPDAHTDFIIAVAAEEYGVVLVLLIIALFASIVLRSVTRLMRERDMFIRLAGTGLIAMLAAQAMINMGVAVRLLPTKGMTLPFISYGGSSLVAAGIGLGMLLSLTRSRPQGEIGDILTRRRRT